MRDVAAVILAGGKAKRFRAGTVKNLLPIDGKPLIMRTVNQLKEHNIRTTILVRDPGPYIKAGVPRELLKTVASRWQTETVLVSRKYWGKDQTLFFFGDAWYSDRCIRLAIAGKRMFFCSTAEIWTISLVKSFYARAETICRSVISTLESNPSLPENLWSFYRVWNGQPFQGALPNTPGLAFRVQGSVIMVLDATVDIDWPREYDALAAGLRGRQVKAPKRPAFCLGQEVVEFLKTGKWRCPITGKLYGGFKQCDPRACRDYVPQGKPKS